MLHSSVKSNSLLTKRFIMCVSGVIICNISVGFFKRALLGVDPYQSFLSGLNSIFTINYGTLSLLTNAVVLLFAFLTNKKLIGIGTIVHLIFGGYIVNYSQALLFHIFPNLSLEWRLVCLFFGVIAMCFSAAIYFVADMGVSPYDSVALILSNTWHIGRFRIIRIITDFVCVCVGVTLFLLSGGKITSLNSIIGIGTIVTAFFMGPLIDFFERTIAIPFLNKNSAHN